MTQNIQSLGVEVKRLLVRTEAVRSGGMHPVATEMC